MAKKIRNRIELNKGNKQLSGQLDVLCDEYISLQQKIDELTHDFDIIKEKIKKDLNEDADYITSKFKIVMSITEAKTEFKYDMEKILKVYPEIKDNQVFGNYKTKASVKRLSSVEELKK